jgi:hypothetical protein
VIDFRWTPDRERYIQNWPTDYEGFNTRWPIKRDVWRNKRNRLVGPQHGLSTPLYQRDDVPEVYWDKKEKDFHWAEVIEPLTAMQGIAKAASNSQDHAHIRIDTDRPVPVLFISDWHIGSWGVNYVEIAQTTRLIQSLGISIACLGDMQQMSIRLRNVMEMGDNLLSPRMQDLFFESWVDDLAAQLLWSTWDNHSVERQESQAGTSRYAEILKEKCIYPSGIGHVDLTVGEHTYKIASSHRFTGNTPLNPTGGQERYMRFEGIDRELTVAGDSHRPSVKEYADGPLNRIAINVGTLQKDSGYAKRFFSLFTHDWMPVVVFCPDRHLMIPYASLQKYCYAHNLNSSELYGTMPSSERVV